MQSYRGDGRAAAALPALATAMDALHTANHRVATALEHAQAQIMVLPGASAALTFTPIDIHCPVALSLVLSAGVAPLDVVYGCLRWQQLVVGNPAWLAAAQAQGVLHYSGVASQLDVDSHYAVQEAVHSGGLKEGTPDCERVLWQGDRPITLAAMPGAMVAAFLACVWHEANKNDAWAEARAGRPSAWLHLVSPERGPAGHGGLWAGWHLWCWIRGVVGVEVGWKVLMAVRQVTHV
jgi:hypothetical protein